LKQKSIIEKNKFKMTL